MRPLTPRSIADAAFACANAAPRCRRGVPRRDRGAQVGTTSVPQPSSVKISRSSVIGSRPLRM
jgi:hypothetical protein